jgi:hypothetical protein
MVIVASANLLSRLIKRTTIVARLFYHTAMCLLSQMNPLTSKDSEEMRMMQQSHSHQICGITAHVKDRYVSSRTSHPAPFHC